MKTAEEFLKEKGIKDTLYDVNNPIPNNWIKGGLSALLDEYRSQPIPTSLQSDVVTAEEFIRRKIREDLRLTGGMKGLSKYLVNGENCLRWAHEYASARIAEMERELQEAKNLVRSITEFADGMKVLDGEALEILKKTARRVLSDTPTKLPRK